MATNMVSDNYSKKLGRKKLAYIKKKTIEIFKSESVKNYPNFLITSKNKINIQFNIKFNYQYAMPQQYFINKVPTIPAPTDFNINNNLLFIDNIISIDNLISNIMLYNNIQQIVDE